jgi:Amt family ammonium transporter
MNDTALNLAWVLICGFLVMLMQVGFAMLETGYARGKNALHTMAMNFVIYPVGVVCFFLVGYAFMMGGVPRVPALGGAAVDHHELAITLAGHRFGLIGAAKFALVNVSRDPASLAMFVFATMFMDTAATIPTGALVERWKFSSFLAYAIFMSAILYPLYGNWVWGGGWLSTLGTSFGLGHGHVDFAGSSVVHLTGAMAALAGSLIVGPRLGKFRRDGTVAVMPGHNLPMAVMGTLILAFGWFGFNAGSTLAATDTQVGIIAANTLVASAGGATAALGHVWVRQGRPDIGMACSGMLGGLVAITGACAFVPVPAAALIGVVAGFLVVSGTELLERRFRIDDPVGAIAVHGVCGVWGAISVGLLADGSYGEGWNGVEGPVRGLLFGDGGQLVAQVVGVCTNVIVCFGLSYLFFFAVDRLHGNRVSQEAEMSGLDVAEIGSDAYHSG